MDTVLATGGCALVIRNTEPIIGVRTPFVTRVPTITYWPGTVKPGTSDALVSQLDIYASIARLVSVEPGDGEATDSRDQLDAWLGRSATGREFLVEESVGGLVLRHGTWKYIPEKENPRPRTATKNIESGFATVPQLYDLGADIGEQSNLASENPELVSELQFHLDRIVGETY